MPGPTARTYYTGVRGRIVLLTGGLATLAALVLVVGVQVVLARSSTNSATEILTARTQVVAASVQGSGTQLQVPPAVLRMRDVTVLDASGREVASSVDPGLTGLMRSVLPVAGAGDVRVEDLETSQGATVRVLSRGFRTDAGTTGTVVVAEPLQAYEEGEVRALVVSLVAGVLLVVVATVLSAVATRRALAPVAEMAAVAAAWSEYALDERFDLGPPTDEIRALGQTLDSLLAKVASALVAERRLTSELAHELRTPLTVIQVTAELAGGRADLDDELREDLTDIVAACRTMAGTMTALLDLARHEATTGSLAEETTEVAAVVGELVDGGSGAEVRVEAPAPAYVRAPAELVRRVVAPVLENATRHADLVDVEIAVEGDAVTVVVADHGAGVDPALAGDLFEPGRSGAGSSGLGLSLSRRIARGLGGDVVLADPGARDAALGGARFLIRLPSA